MAFAIKTEILQELMQNPEWDRKLKEAMTIEDAMSVIEAFCKERGYKARAKEAWRTFALGQERVASEK